MTTHRDRVTQGGTFLLAGVMAAGLTLGAGQALAQAGLVQGPQHRASTPAPEPALPPDLAELRDALRKYEDPVVAIRDGYLSTLGCVAYANGAMGVHFLNAALVGPTPDPLRPALLVYEPAEQGRLRLVAAEWFVPLATGITERPVLFGQPFNGPMAGHEPLMPTELHHYDLHVWLFKENPDGLFAVTNPNVGCAGHPYALMEAPTDLPPHRH
ncbi:hypothetical protein [Falsiroseomonas oryziterrae]|uniref:hypothetical protein n=1 Tax=Falsiroseomonas oryziterrae TaxID=2911368 RepID=UPI001F26E6B6|nr:hypothetical protein [Roseomonas sp. NPKOSM-4]